MGYAGTYGEVSKLFLNIFTPNDISVVGGKIIMEPLPNGMKFALPLQYSVLDAHGQLLFTNTVNSGDSEDVYTDSGSPAIELEMAKIDKNSFITIAFPCELDPLVEHSWTQQKVTVHMEYIIQNQEKRRLSTIDSVWMGNPLLVNYHYIYLVQA